jgi:hypothetical protein
MGVDPELLKAELIAKGRAGVNSKGEIIRAGRLTENDDILEIVCQPGLRSDGKPAPIFVLLPDSFNWSLNNSEDPLNNSENSKYRAHRGGKILRGLHPGNSKFFHNGYDGKFNFSIIYTPEMTSSQEAPSSQPKAERPLPPKPEASSASSQQPKKTAPVPKPAAKEPPSNDNIPRIYQEFVDKRNDPYSLLGVAQTATDEEISKAYYELAFKLDPDKNMGENQKTADEVFKLLSEAYTKIKKDRETKKM